MDLLYQASMATGPALADALANRDRAGRTTAPYLVTNPNVPVDVACAVATEHRLFPQLFARADIDPDAILRVLLSTPYAVRNVVGDAKARAAVWAAPDTWWDQALATADSSDWARLALDSSGVLTRMPHPACRIERIVRAIVRASAPTGVDQAGDLGPVSKLLHAHPDVAAAVRARPTDVGWADVAAHTAQVITLPVVNAIAGSLAAMGGTMRMWLLGTLWATPDAVEPLTNVLSAHTDTNDIRVELSDQIRPVDGPTVTLLSRSAADLAGWAATTSHRDLAAAVPLIPDRLVQAAVLNDHARVQIARAADDKLARHLLGQFGTDVLFDLSLQVMLEQRHITYAVADRLDQLDADARQALWATPASGLPDVSFNDVVAAASVAAA